MHSHSSTSDINDRPSHTTIKVAGFMFLFAFIFPAINWVFVLSPLNMAEDAVGTAKNIVADELMFRIGISIELILSVGLIVLGLALYIMLKAVHKHLALLALSLKLVEASLMAVTVLIPFIALQTLNTDPEASSLVQEQLLTPIGVIFNAHTTITAIPMVFLGLDMMLFSYLFFKSKYIPRMLAGFGVLSFALIFIQSFMFILAPEYATLPINQIIFWTPSGLFEIIIGAWLLVNGINIPST